MNEIEKQILPPEQFTDNIRPRWYPRVPQDKIRRLYGNDARGLVDEILLEDVGLGLLHRCQSILIATEAHEGRARCPRCGEMIPHDWRKEEIMTCAGCGWQTTWGAYFKTYQGKQLHGGGAVAAFKDYIEHYERARTLQERMLLIDHLLHAFHWELTQNPTRPAACNLIEGKIAEVIAFLDDLTYGERSTRGTQEERAAWHGKANRSPWIREMLEAHRARCRIRDGD